MSLKQTVWAEEWQNYSPFWLPSSLHPDKWMISFPVGIQHWLGSFRLSTQADPDDITRTSSSPSFPGALFFVNQHLYSAFTRARWWGRGAWVITRVIFLPWKGSYGKQRLLFAPTCLPTTRNPTQKAAGYKKAILRVSVGNQVLPALQSECRVNLEKALKWAAG